MIKCRYCDMESIGAFPIPGPIKNVPLVNPINGEYLFEELCYGHARQKGLVLSAPCDRCNNDAKHSVDSAILCDECLVGTKHYMSIPKCDKCDRAAVGDMGPMTLCAECLDKERVSIVYPDMPFPVVTESELDAMKVGGVTPGLHCEDEYDVARTEGLKDSMESQYGRPLTPEELNEILHNPPQLVKLTDEEKKAADRINKSLHEANKLKEEEVRRALEKKLDELEAHLHYMPSPADYVWEEEIERQLDEKYDGGSVLIELEKLPFETLRWLEGRFSGWDINVHDDGYTFNTR